MESAMNGMTSTFFTERIGCALPPKRRQASLERRPRPTLKDVLPGAGTVELGWLDGFRGYADFRAARLLQLEPVEGVRSQGKKIGKLANRRKARMAEQLHGNHSFVG